MSTEWAVLILLHAAVIFLVAEVFVIVSEERKLEAMRREREELL